MLTPPATFLLTPGALLPTPSTTLAMRTAQWTAFSAGRTERPAGSRTGVATDQPSGTVSLAGLVEAVAGTVRAGPRAAVRTGEQSSTGLGAGGGLRSAGGPTEDQGLVRTQLGLAGGHQAGTGGERIATQSSSGGVTAGQYSILQPDLAGAALLVTQRPAGVAALQHQITSLQEGKLLELLEKCY